MASVNEELVISLSKHGGPVYAGRSKGSKLRSRYNLDVVDKTPSTKVKIIIPKETYSINSSFFLGFLGDSIRNAGTKLNFLDKFSFVMPDLFVPKIYDYIDRALHEKKSLI